MSNDDFIQTTRSERLRHWILAEMMRGAGYAAVVLIGIGVTVGVIYLVGLLLPEESKNAPPPMPYSQLEAPLHKAIG